MGGNDSNFEDLARGVANLGKDTVKKSKESSFGKKAINSIKSKLNNIRSKVSSRVGNFFTSNLIKAKRKMKELGKWSK